MNLREQSAQARNELVDGALAIMQQRLADEELSLAQLARELAVSERHLQRAFHERGSDGYRWELTRLRMETAARLFAQDPHRSVARTAAAVGYRQPPQFAKAFRRHLGMTPKEWRNRCRLQAAVNRDAPNRSGD
jgi:AraC family transcriptional regulator of adaptative response / methylphosphotriester-DNA alkyltransferase methyltransferase